MSVSVGSRIWGCSFINRRIFLACKRFILSDSFTTSLFTKPMFLRYLKECNRRSIYAEKKCYGDKREWVVTHLAEQEIALSALRRLELAVNKSKRAKKSDVELILKGSLKDIFVNDKDAIFLIRCCGSLLANESIESRRTIAKAVWDKICSSSILLENEHMQALLKTNLENRNPVCPKQFLSYMKELGIVPNEETLRMLLSCVSVVEKSEEKVAYVVEELKSRGSSINREFYETLASALAEQGNVLEAEDIVKSMKKRELDIASSVYASLVKGHIMTGKKEPVLKLLNQLDKMEVKLSPLEFTSVISTLALVSSLPENKSKKLIESIMPCISIPQSQDTHHYVLNAIVELLHCGEGMAACKLLLSLPQSLQLGGKFDEHLPIVFCKELARADIAPEEVLKICNHLEEFMVSLLKQEGCLKPFALYTVAGYALQSANSELSLFLLETLIQRRVPLRPHYFWPILLCAAKQENEEKREEGIVSVLRKMKSLGVTIDCETLAVYALPYTKPRSDALQVLTLLQQTGIHGIACRTALTQWLLDKGELIEAARFNDLHRGKIDPSLLIEPLVRCIIRKIDQLEWSSPSSLAQLLKLITQKKMRNIDYVGHFLLELSEKFGLFENNNTFSEEQARALDYLLKILKVLDAKNMRISKQATDYLLDALNPQLELSELGQARPLVMPPVDDELFLPVSEFQPFIPHPREMGKEDLEAHTVELRAKGLNDRGALRRLFQLHCRQRNVKRALEVKRDLESAGHSFSPGMLSSFLDLLTQNGELEKAEDVFHRLKSEHPEFKLDDHKAIDLAALMCQRGQVNEGVTLLQRHAESVQVRPGPPIERNLINLLFAVHRHEGVTGKVEASTGEEKVGHWTPATLINELIRLGYVNNPPPPSMTTKLKNICGLILST